MKVRAAQQTSGQCSVTHTCYMHPALLRAVSCRAKLHEMEVRKQMERMSVQRKAAAGLANTNERIRSYNYQDGRVSDHRVGITINVDVPRFMAGDRLGEVINAVKLQHQQELLQEMLAEG